jgi:hypothetical protein
MQVERNQVDAKIVYLRPETSEEAALLEEWFEFGVTCWGGGSTTALICTKYFGVDH